MMSKCARPGCLKEGINRCSKCLREPYCSGQCQKEDWRVHKLICKSLKKFSYQLQLYSEVAGVIEDTCEGLFDKQLDARIKRHLISYVEHQFGDRIPGRAYRENLNGIRVDNYDYELDVLLPLYTDLVNIYSTDESLGTIVSLNLKFPYFKRMLDILRPWSAKFDFNSASRVDCLDRDQTNRILSLLSQTELNVALILLNRNEYNTAKSYCQEALSHARLYKGKAEKKTDLICGALEAMYELRASQGNYRKALIFAEEAYNLAATAYNPVHPKVQLAASTLIQCLMHKGNFDSLSDANRFAQATLDSLRDSKNGMDQQSEDVALGYYNLASVISKQEGDLVKAETLVREALRIRTRLYGSDHRHVGLSCNLLASILSSQGNTGNETMELFERSLANDTKNYGPNGSNTAISNHNFGTFYNRLAGQHKNTPKFIEFLRLSKSKYMESVRIYTKIYGPAHPETRQASSILSKVSLTLSELE